MSIIVERVSATHATTELFRYRAEEAMSGGFKTSVSVSLVYAQKIAEFPTSCGVIFIESDNSTLPPIMLAWRIATVLSEGFFFEEIR